MSREYMDEQDRAYVQATKRHFRQWMERNGWSPDDLANITKVPATTIRRWLSPLNDQFMPLGAAHHICRRLGIDIQAILLPQGSTTTARATRIFLQLPPKHADMMVEQWLQIARTLGVDLDIDTS